MKMYTELASWWPLLSTPADYDEEAEEARQIMVENCLTPPQTLLELGSGGGNNASFLKKHFQMTLVDLSPGMLAVSQALNPECEHLQGDMRTLRLGRQFDCVFIHDAICYMTSLDDLRATMLTAYTHLKPGGAVLLEPDLVREIFKESTNHGGHDASDGRGMRYLEWTYDPDPSDNTYITDFAFLLRQADGTLSCTYEQHVIGLFSEDEWLQLLAEAGFEAKSIEDGFERIIFVGRKRPPYS